jgi:hypothetical protein
MSYQFLIAYLIQIHQSPLSILTHLSFSTYENFATTNTLLSLTNINFTNPPHKHGGKGEALGFDNVLLSPRVIYHEDLF